MRFKGYTKLSLSKLTGISRPTIDQILKAESPNSNIYNTQISKINQTFELPSDYFLESRITITPPEPVYAYSDHGAGEERSERAQHLLDGLDNILDIYALYLK
ncbi:helix-turn-helix domain-containing protein [Paenibacillus tundrae]